MTVLLLVVASIVAAFVSGAAGFGGGLMLLPIVITLFGPERAIPILTIAQIIGNGSRMMFGFREIAWRKVGLFLVASLPLSVAGTIGFASLPEQLVSRCVGAVLVLLVVFKLASKREFRAGTKTMLAGGAVSGFVSGLVGTAGPIGAAVFFSLGLSPVAYVASEAATATAAHVVKTVMYSRLVTVDGDSFRTGLIMGAAMILGSYIANRFIRHIAQESFRKWVTLFLLAIGAYMVIRPL